MAVETEKRLQLWANPDLESVVSEYFDTGGHPVTIDRAPAAPAFRTMEAADAVLLAAINGGTLLLAEFLKGLLSFLSSTKAKTEADRVRIQVGDRFVEFQRDMNPAEMERLRAVLGELETPRVELITR